PLLSCHSSMASVRSLDTRTGVIHGRLYSAAASEYVKLSLRLFSCFLCLLSPEWLPEVRSSSQSSKIDRHFRVFKYRSDKPGSVAIGTKKSNSVIGSV